MQCRLGSVPLCCRAAGYGRLALVRLLLERGAALEAANGKQQTPADVAALNGEVRGAAVEGGRLHAGCGSGSCGWCMQANCRAVRVLVVWASTEQCMAAAAGPLHTHSCKDSAVDCPHVVCLLQL
jgi:ankyrin repeat protein